MAWFSTVYYRNRRFFSYGIIIAAFFVILFGSNSIRPVIANVCLAVTYYPFAELRDSIKRMQEVADSNNRLKNALTEVTLQLNALSEVERENRRLRAFLGFEQPEGYQVIPVKILTLHQDQYPIAAVINKGSNDSIFTELPVVNRFGLVGKIKEVMPDYSIVQLLTNPANAVSARIAETRQIGIVRYIPSEGMIFDNLPADAPVNKGDMVISSGLGGVYPAGLSVAVVDSVAPPRSGIKKSVWLKPSANFLEIEELYVLRSTL
jgi:rod shape-determining protein MreC